MKKKQFKFKGVVLACCLAASMPLGATIPFEISAMADTGTQNPKQQDKQQQPQKPQQEKQQQPQKPQQQDKQQQQPQNGQNQKKKPSDVVSPEQPDKGKNTVPGKATPSVPKKPGGGKGRSRGGSGGSGGGSKRGGSTNNKNNNSSTSGAWISDAKGWWYKETNGSYPKSTWKEISYNGVKSWYYFDEQGYMTTGWKLINGKWYYMYESTEKHHIKGSMARNTKIGEYKVGSDGAWVK